LLSLRAVVLRIVMQRAPERGGVSPPVARRFGWDSPEG
jgi:hypothetical protein